MRVVQFHGLPNIVHYGGSKTPGKMEVGQIFTIEPMINLGTSNLGESPRASLSEALDPDSYSQITGGMTGQL